MTRPNLTDITLILDRSGSMDGIKDDTIEAYNKFISEQQKEVSGECYFSLIQFDHEYLKVHSHQPIKDIPLLDNANFVPRGNTALIDAIGQTVDETGKRLTALPEDERPSNVLMVILTDGQENASKRYTREQIRMMIKRQEDVYNWDFVFLAADQDAVTVGTSYGIKGMSSMSYSGGKMGPKGANGPSGTRCVVAAMNAAVKHYRSSGASNKSNFFEGTESLQAGDDLDNQVVSAEVAAKAVDATKKE